MYCDADSSGIRCTILIATTLELDWSDWFFGVEVEVLADGSTLLKGHLQDQGALHGLLLRVADLGLPLLCVDVDGGCGKID